MKNDNGLIKNEEAKSQKKLNLTYQQKINDNNLLHFPQI